MMSKYYIHVSVLRPELVFAHIFLYVVAIVLFKVDFRKVNMTGVIAFVTQKVVALICIVKL